MTVAKERSPSIQKQRHFCNEYQIAPHSAISLSSFSLYILGHHIQAKEEYGDCTGDSATATAKGNNFF